jgi:4-hydroxyphenylpyruvate dioxygenase
MARRIAKEQSVSVNPLGLKGIEFVEFCSPNPESIRNLLVEFGFSKLLSSSSGDIEYFMQNDINILLNVKPQGHAASFSKLHGPSLSSMALRVEDAAQAFETSILRGAKPAKGEFDLDGAKIPAIYGIGDSLIYFVDAYQNLDFYSRMGLKKTNSEILVKDKGFLSIDHLTNNVEKGTMQKWADFYKNIFAFTEVRYFDIKGEKTGLISYALKSPCGTFCIPINEGTDKKSQINEYLEEYKGPGIQHLAFLTNDIISSLEAFKANTIETLTIDDEYYEDIFTKMKDVTEDHEKLKKLNILIDGDEKGYLLQIFTKNLIGPIFIEIIQRKNHYSFGEGNFGALFRSIEKDQQKRGYLD